MTSPPRENAARVRRFLIDVVAGGDTDAGQGLLDADVVDRNLVYGDCQNRETMPAMDWRVLAATDIDVTIEETVATTDRVAGRATVAGTHRESLMDLAPTGHPFEIAHAWFCRVENGRLVEIRSLPDGLGLMRNLGGIPDRSGGRCAN